MTKYAKRVNSKYSNKYDLYEGGEKVGESAMYGSLFGKADKVHQEKLEKQGYKIRTGIGDFRGGTKLKIDKVKVQKASLRKANFRKASNCKPPVGRAVKLPN